MESTFNTQVLLSSTKSQENFLHIIKNQHPQHKDNTDYNEDLIISAGLNMQLSASVYLIDLLRLEYTKDIRTEFLKTYLNDISRIQGFKYVENYEDLEKRSIVLLDSFTACIYSHKIFYITCSDQKSDISRANLNTFIESKKPIEPVETHTILANPGHTYIFVSVCKNLMNQGAEVNLASKSVNFDNIKSTTKDEIAAYIYATTKISAKNLLFKINEAKEILQTDCSDLSIASNDSIGNISIIECSTIKPTYKPICDLLVFSHNRSSFVSLEYTISDDTGRADTSFRLSNTITGRFPRMSGSSIAMIETPSKEAKKSFIDYTEYLESPRFSSINASTYRIITATPIKSPRQSSLSIQEVKNYLLTGNKKRDILESPYGKITLKKARSPGLRTFSYQDSDSKSIATDVCTSNELNKSKTIFEEKKSSCQCQSCYIF